MELKSVRTLKSRPMIADTPADTRAAESALLRGAFDIPAREARVADGRLSVGVAEVVDGPPSAESPGWPGVRSFSRDSVTNDDDNGTPYDRHVRGLTGTHLERRCGSGVNAERPAARCATGLPDHSQVKSGGVLLSHRVPPAVPSALRVLASGFGM